MTLIEEEFWYDVANGTGVSVFGILESAIGSMSGTTLSITNLTGRSIISIHKLGNASQSLPTGGRVTSGSKTGASPISGLSVSALERGMSLGFHTEGGAVVNSVAWVGTNPINANTGYLEGNSMSGFWGTRTSVANETVATQADVNITSTRCAGIGVAVNPV